MNVLNVDINGPNKYLELLDEAWLAHLAPRKPNAPTVVSLFAGCGGSSLGYSMAGYRELLAVEWNDNAVKTFKLNFPNVPLWTGDIRKLSVDECFRLTNLKPGELDILDGSPPCQGFSSAGKRKFTDLRNDLSFEFIRLLRGLQPKVFLMENVSGMVRGKMKLIFAEVMRKLKASGYQVCCKLLNAMYFNVPQHRERLIWIGIRNDINIALSYPKPQNRPLPAKCIQPSIEGMSVTWRMRGGNHRKRTFDFVAPTVDRTGGHVEINKVRKRWPIEDAAKLQSFPPSFIFSEKGAIALIGDCVPPLFMRAIAEHIQDLGIFKEE